MEAVLIGQLDFGECPKCHGIWADADSLEQLCADREKQAAVLGIPTHLPELETVALETVRYVPCPVCKKLMNRVNFARCSNVVVDVCKGHGTWFDRDELRRMVEFIRGGGLEAARAKEMAELEERQRQANAANTARSFDNSRESSASYPEWEVGLSAAAKVLKAFLR